MALTTIQSNNRLTVFRQEITREFVRENLFSPYMGSGKTSIIRILNDLQKRGQQINIPLVTRLNGTAKGIGTLVGNEERIDNYGMRMWIDLARNAVKTDKMEEQKDSADIFGEAKDLLADWGKELQRDELIEAFMALPSESPPALLNTADGGRVNGILYEAATPTERNTWNAANSDRVLYGNAIGNYNATHATALGNVDATDDLFTAGSVSLMKLIARKANPRIRPFKVSDGREYFVAFCGSLPFRDLKISLQTINKDARPREAMGSNGATNNPIFQDGDQIYDGVIVREVPEIDLMVEEKWTSLLTAGGSSTRVNPVFLCGQSAAAIAYGQMPKPTFLKEDDYQAVTGAGIDMIYGIGKCFKRHPMDGTALKQWGMLTGFFANTSL